MASFRIRPIDAASEAEVAVVAERMRLTLMEVIGDKDGNPMGLFSTTYVAESARHLGIADALIAEGERWMRERSLPFAATHTSETNTPLIRLYEKHQYAIILRIAEDKMIRLGKFL
jgi:GNAT superfamily N-acetyltransferase